MNHDIAHCEGSHCKQRNRCHRYEAHLDLQEQDVQTRINKANYISPAECIERNYDSYVPNERKK